MLRRPSVLRFQGDNNIIIYRHHIDDFVVGSQLIVNESQEAIFFKDGRALDLFGAGRHLLQTDNLPLLRRFFGALFGGANPFQCEVYFINKVAVLDLLWGTESPITIEDPKYGLIVDVKAHGQMGIRISDARRFIVNVSGTLQQYTVDEIKRDIRGAVVASVKQSIATAIIKKGISILEISANIDALSAEITASLNAKLRNVGLEVTHFYANKIAADPADLEKLREIKEKRLEAMTDLDIDTMRTMRMSEAKAYARKTEGYTYHDEKKYEILSEAAKNEGPSSALMNAGVGLGMGSAIGSQIKEAAGSVMSTGREAASAKVASLERCPACNAPMATGAKFCPECGAKRPESKKFCTECGCELAPGAKFCSACGAKLL